MKILDTIVDQVHLLNLLNDVLRLGSERRDQVRLESVMDPENQKGSSKRTFVKSTIYITDTYSLL